MLISIIIKLRIN